MFFSICFFSLHETIIIRHQLDCLKVSISPTYYEQLFFAQKFAIIFLMELYWLKKAALKMLEKFTTGRQGSLPPVVPSAWVFQSPDPCPEQFWKLSHLLPPQVFLTTLLLHDWENSIISFF